MVQNVNRFQYRADTLELTHNNLVVQPAKTTLNALFAVFFAAFMLYLVTCKFLENKS